MKELHRQKLKYPEHVSPLTNLKVYFDDRVIASTNLGDKPWVFNEIVIVETIFEGRRTLGVLLMES